MGTTILEELMTYLFTQTALTALVARRIYPSADLRRKNNVELPCIGYEVTSDVPVHTMGSDSTNPGRPLVTYHVYADNYASGKAVSAALRTALTDKTGTLTARTVQRVFFENEYDVDDSDDSTHIVVDFIIWYT